jgi:hypothetical protein
VHLSRRGIKVQSRRCGRLSPPPTLDSSRNQPPPSHTAAHTARHPRLTPIGVNVAMQPAWSRSCTHGVRRGLPGERERHPAMAPGSRSVSSASGIGSGRSRSPRAASGLAPLNGSGRRWRPPRYEDSADFMRRSAGPRRKHQQARCGNRRRSRGRAGVRAGRRRFPGRGAGWLRGWRASALARPVAETQRREWLVATSGSDPPGGMKPDSASRLPRRWGAPDTRIRSRRGDPA